MKFSIAIPAYKPDYLAEAVSSILAQTFSDWELVIVDDCSPADLRSIVTPFLADSRVRYYRNEKNIGALDVVDNWNRCLEYCTGDYVICMGDDDRLLPHCLEDLQAVIRQHPGLCVFHIQAEMIDDSGTVIESFPERPVYESALDLLARRWKKNSRQYIGDFCFDRRQLLAEGGFYKLPLAWGSDDITAFRAASKTGIANTQRTGFQYRQTSKSLSSNEMFEVKASAMVSAGKWFSAALSEFSPSSLAQEATRQHLLKSCPSYTRYLCGEYLKTDTGKRPGRLSFWLGHRKEYGLSAAEVYLLSIKGIIQKHLGAL